MRRLADGWILRRIEADLSVPDTQTVLIRYPEQLFATALMIEITDPAIQSVQIAALRCRFRTTAGTAAIPFLCLLFFTAFSEGSLFAVCIGLHFDFCAICDSAMYDSVL